MTGADAASGTTGGMGAQQQALRVGVLYRQACSSSARRFVLISLRSSAEIRCTCRNKEPNVEALRNG